MPDITIINSNPTLQTATVGITTATAAPEVFALEATLLATARADGSNAYATDTKGHYQRQNSLWVKTVGSQLGSATLNALLATAGSMRTTLYVARGLTLSASVTIPANIELRFIDSGQITVATGQTLTIRGSLIADLRKIFACVGTGRVQFGTNSDYSGEGKQALRPEWWGAKGDAASAGNGWTGTDDTAAVQACFDAASGNGTPNRIVFVSGKRYLVTSVVVGNANTGGSLSYVVDGIGAGLVANTVTNTPILQLGNHAIGKYIHSFVMHGLQISGNGTFAYAAGSTCLYIDHCDQLRIQNASIGGAYYGVRSGAFGSDSAQFLHLNVGGCEYAVKILGSSDTNVFLWYGGKVQQNKAHGIWYSGTNFSIKNIDVSLCIGSALRLENCSEGEVQIYTENIGSGALYSLFGIGGTGVANSDKVFHLIGCEEVELKQNRVNTVASVYGQGVNGNGYNNTAAYGVYLEACQNIELRGNHFLRALKAHVYIDANTTDTFIAGSNRAEESFSFSGTTMVEFVRVADYGRRTVNRCQLSDLTVPKPPYEAHVRKLINGIVSSCDLSDGSWAIGPAMSIDGSTVLAPDGASRAQVINFEQPYVNGGYAISAVSPVAVGSGLNGKTLVIRAWIKLISHGDSVASRPGDGPVPLINWSVARYPYTDTTDAIVFANIPCLGMDWQLIEFRFQPPTRGGDSNTFSFNFRPNYVQNMQLAVWGLQAAVADSMTDPVAYYAKSGRVGALVEAGAYGILSQGPNVIAYGAKSTRQIVTESSPQSLSLAAPSGDMTWRVGDLAWNSAPASGQPAGWICTVAGAPGTWKAFGTLA